MAVTEASSVDRDVSLADLLAETSRTFALAIPLLRSDLERQVRVAYLLFRIADTIEDATVEWSRDERLAELEAFAELLRTPAAAAARELALRWRKRPPTSHAGYRRLLDRTPEVLEEALAVGDEPARVILRHTVRTTLGMAGFVRRTQADGALRLADLADLQAYCYVVAGIVGEMLTELFLLARPQLEPVASELRERAAAFGEGLQLTNILKDSAGDHTEGRNFLPANLDPRRVFELARTDLRAAEEYVLTVQRAGGCDGVALFTGLSVALAFPTLEKVERHGAGAKISRARVFTIYNRLQRAVERGEPVFKR